MASIEAPVAGHEPISVDRGVSSHKEIRQHSPPGAAGPPICAPGAARSRGHGAIVRHELHSHPIEGGAGVVLIPEGREMDQRINSQAHFITPDYFRALQIRIEAGRAFTAADVREAPLVMIVNETLAREAFGGLDPIGRRISCCEGKPGEPSWKIVVGVVGDVRSRGPAREPIPEFYLPLAQIPDVAWSWIDNTLDVLVRPVDGDPIALADTIRGAVAEMDPSLPVYAIRTMDEGLRRSTAAARFNTSFRAPS